MNRIHVKTQSNAPWLSHLSSDQLFSHHLHQLDHAFRGRGLVGEFAQLQDAFRILVSTEADRSQGDGPILALANSVLIAAQMSGMNTLEALITGEAETWAATAAAGAAAGLGLSRNASAVVQVVAMVGGGLIGAAAGSRLKAEVPIYRLHADTFGNLTWVPVRPGSAMPLQLAVR